MILALRSPFFFNSTWSIRCEVDEGDPVQPTKKNEVLLGFLME